MHIDEEKPSTEPFDYQSRAFVGNLSYNRYYFWLEMAQWSLSGPLIVPLFLFHMFSLLKT